MLCVKSISSYMENFCKWRDIAKTALLLRIISFLDIISQLCMSRKLVEFLKVVSVISQNSVSDLTKHLKSYHQK